MKKLLIIGVAFALFACNKSSNTSPILSTGNGIKAGVYTDLINLNNVSGFQPDGSLIISGNTLYGMTNGGGAYAYGTIFSVNVNGSGYTLLHNFDDSYTDGEYPTGDLTLFGGVLYGMTGSGGQYSEGVIFAINPDGTNFHVLHDFGGVIGAGAFPYGNLVINSQGVMFGMTSEGGSAYDGNIFSIHNDGSAYTDLHDFSRTDGDEPFASLVLSGTVLYGTTTYGGLGGFGNIFSINTNGTGFKDLMDFNGTNGKVLRGNLIISGSTLYGMASTGAADGDGCIFSIGTNGSGFKTLYNFSGGTGGNYPEGALTLYGSTLYGMTMEGGSTGNDGMVFSIETSGSGFKDLLNFNGTNGENPTGSLLLSGDMLYGMTSMGGTNSDGVIFSFSL